jgi:hypothetical protein
MKRILSVLTLGVLLGACSDDSNECACYEAALNNAELSEACQSLVKELSEDELKEKSNECFVGAIEELSGM